MKTEGWQKRLREAIAERAKSEFKWGEFDCVTFACECAIAVTEDSSLRMQMHRHFGQWKTAAEACNAHGLKLAECVSKVLGEPIRASMLCMGDIGLASLDGRDALVVCDGFDFHGPAYGVGLQKVPRELVQLGWRL